MTLKFYYTPVGTEPGNANEKSLSGPLRCYLPGSGTVTYTDIVAVGTVGSIDDIINIKLISDVIIATLKFEETAVVGQIAATRLDSIFKFPAENFVANVSASINSRFGLHSIVFIGSAVKTPDRIIMSAVVSPTLASGGTTTQSLFFYPGLVTPQTNLQMSVAVEPGAGVLARIFPYNFNTIFDPLAEGFSRVVASMLGICNLTFNRPMTSGHGFRIVMATLGIPRLLGTIIQVSGNTTTDKLTRFSVITGLNSITRSPGTKSTRSFWNDVKTSATCTMIASPTAGGIVLIAGFSVFKVRELTIDVLMTNNINIDAGIFAIEIPIAETTGAYSFTLHYT